MHGVIQPPQPSCIPLDETLLPEIMKDYGYSTHIVGKWHLGMYKPACLPTERGFDSHFGILLGAGEYYNHTYSYYLNSEDVTMEGKDFRFTADGVADDKVQETYDGVYSTTAYVGRVKEIIDETAESSSPLFLYVAFQNVHKPIEVPSEYVALYNGGPLSGTRKRYAGMVSALDDAVGEIVSELKTAGLYNDSVIIFSTDNGGVHIPSNNWPLRGAKHSLWEGGIRAVGFVHSRAYIPSCNVGKISQDLIHVSDWLPSLAEGLLEETLPEPSDNAKALDGINVWDYFAECFVEEPLRNELLHNIDPLYLAGRVKANQYSADGILQVSETFDTSIHAALRVGDMKILTGKQGSLLREPPPESSSTAPTETVNEDQSVWLFNITADPYELNDLSTEEAEIVNEMVAKLAEYWESDKRANILFPQSELEADPGEEGYWGPWRNDDESLI
ncbi:Arylsulfatase B [Holothuria leucospilota]|uniref:Arylsulfatase B n=1 Tax=Holothuria leucospilota TaxID=206669 RepID=A0A9Q1BM36_HOLLE|nr:Arylsulfatase B [Holothuria leucospilota]